MKKSFLSLLLIGITLIANAYDFMVDGLCYNFNSDGTSVTVTYQNTSSPRYSNLSGALNIPSSVTYNGNTYSVISIGEYAFNGCSGLTSVTIGNSVTSISSTAFQSCSSLTSVIWNAKTCNDFSFNYSPFKNLTNIKSFTFGNEVEKIPAYLCFQLSGLTSITIPNSVTSIGNGAFYGCSGLTSVNISDLAAWCNIDFNSNPLYYAHNLYINGIKVTDLVIPNSVTSIGNGAFYGCSGLTSVNLGNSVTSIGERSFQGCAGLTSVTIPNSVTSIGDAAFSGCTGLTSVEIPNSVTSIGYAAFGNCSSLTSVIWNAKNCNDFINSYNEYPFYNLTNIRTFTIGDEVERIPAHLCYKLKGLTSITIPNLVTEIGRSSFEGCNGLNIAIIGEKHWR